MTPAQKIEVLKRAQAALKARLAEIEACAFCQKNKGKMAPPHFASPNCESGKHNHCTCDACF